MMTYLPVGLPTATGWMTPNWRIESASSSSASSSNRVRGCVGLGTMSAMSISAISAHRLELGVDASLPNMASSPRPNPFCCFIVLSLYGSA